MLFGDQGLASFRYPSSWEFDGRVPSQVTPAIWPDTTGPSEVEAEDVIFTDHVAGISSWPVTDFVQLMFSYARRRMTSEICQQASAPDPGDRRYADVKVGVLTFHHGGRDNAFAQESVHDEIYTIFNLGSVSSHGLGTCFLFDLATESAGGTTDRAPRALTLREVQKENRILYQILESVRIPGIPAQHLPLHRTAPTGILKGDRWLQPPNP